MKVLFVSNDFPNFWAHRMNLVTAFLRAGNQVWLCAGGDSTEAVAKLPIGVHFIKLELNQHKFDLNSDLRLLLKFHKITKEINPDIVHAFTIKPVLYYAVVLALKSITGIPLPRLVMTFPGLGKVFEPGGRFAGALRRWLVSTGLRTACARLNHVATFENSRDQDILIQKGIFKPSNTLAIMGAGIDLSLFYPAPSKNAHAPLTFLFASRLLKAKGVETFIESAKSLAHSGSKSRFILAGSSDVTNPDKFDVVEYEALHSLGPVEYLGAISAEKMADLLRIADVVCLPTQLSEGFPRILLEGAACGCALIASDQPAIRQIIIDEKTGWLFDPRHPNKLTEIMRKAESSPKHTRSLGKFATEHIRSANIDDKSVIGIFSRIYSNFS